MDSKEIIEFVKAVNSDVSTCLKRISDGEDFQFWARMYIRSLASLIEGTAHVDRVIVMEWSKSGELNLNSEQHLYFFNIDWNVSKSGDVKISEKRLPTKAMLKALFKQLETLLPSYEANFAHDGWGKLMEFYPARDALIHPKSMSGLAFTWDQLQAIDKGRVWLLDEQKRINEGFAGLARKMV